MRVLVLSNGPVPHAAHVVVEGGGLRSWGLARGLQAHGIEVTVGVDAAHGDLETDVNGIRVTSFRRDEALIRLMEHVDAVLVSYCMGATTEYVMNQLPSGVLLLGDAYVPIHVEVAAREAEDVELEQKEFLADLPRWNSALQRCDALLAASPEQELYYTGLLAGLGRVTPESYRERRLLRVPFGIHLDEEPPTERDRSDGRLKALWFGGVYPWFDAGALTSSLQLARERGVPADITMAGAKNPFVQHEHFVQHADAAVRAAEATQDITILDWLPYSQRRRAYETSDVIVSLNTIGPENKFSWRTRLVDYVWSGMPLLTNGGDPLAERLIAAGAAHRLEAATPEAVADAFELMHREPERMPRMRDQMSAQRAALDWRDCVSPLVQTLNAGLTSIELPVLQVGPSGAGVAVGSAAVPTTVTQARVAAAKTYAVRARRYARTYGARRTAVVAARVLSSKMPKPSLTPAAPHLWVISHQLDTSGAPKVALDVAADARRALGRGRVSIIGFPPVAPSRLMEARRADVPVHALERGMPLPLIRPHDSVLLNSLAVPPNVVHDVLWRLEHGRLAHVQWFVHEDQPQRWWDPGLVPRVASLVESGKLRLLVPSVQMRERHARHLWLDEGIDLVPLRIEVPQRLQRARGPEDFSRLAFHLTGAAHDGRKGHAAALTAFQELVLTTDMSDASRWRDFELQFIGLGDDFMSGELRHLGAALLGKRFTPMTAAPHDSVLRIMSKANVVLCCAVYEAFGLYISESMAMGHVVLRNSAAGMEEQLEDGRNGLWIGDQDQAAFVAALRRVLDRQATGDDELARWSRRSTELAAPSLTAAYADLARWSPAAADPVGGD
jgi:glycosyltransferase involved in cell wall biosynthesis